MLNKIIDLKKFIKAYKERIIKEYKLYLIYILEIIQMWAVKNLIMKYKISILQRNF